MPCRWCGLHDAIRLLISNSSKFVLQLRNWLRWLFFHWLLGIMLNTIPTCLDVWFCSHSLWEKVTKDLIISRELLLLISRDIIRRHVHFISGSSNVVVGLSQSLVRADGHLFLIAILSSAKYEINSGFSLWTSSC